MTPSDPLAAFSDCLDLGQVTELRALTQQGEPDFFAELARLYLNSAPAMLQQLADHLARADYPSVRAQAHTLKGMSGNIGAFCLQEAAHVLEEKARLAREPLGPTDLVPLSTAHARVEQALRTFLREAA